MKKLILLFAFALLNIVTVLSQCAPNQSTVIITIVPDNYPEEITWKLYANNVQVATGAEPFTNSSVVCVDAAACLQFQINDSYGDGICCGATGNGSYTVLLNGVQVATGGEFTSTLSHYFNCPPGSYCENPLALSSTGTYQAPSPNTFYSFTPNSTGIYSVSTCNLGNCDTKLWVYSACNANVSAQDGTGAQFYNDNNASCGNLADLDSITLVAGTPYIIRVGANASPPCLNPIGFSVSYIGAISGCMDPSACNYNPLATISINNCVYPPFCGGPIQHAVNKPSGSVLNAINDIDSIRFNGTQTEMQIVLTNGTVVNHAISDINNVTFTPLTGVYPAGTVHCGGVATTVVDVTNPITGKTWMDRNLGASQVALSRTDMLAFGDLYQWGRRADGHQCRTSPNTATLSSVNQPANGSFIIAPSAPFDWRSPQNDNLWQGVNGVNNPCPSGYRIPTQTELDNERISWSTQNHNGAFASPLKWTTAGHREAYNSAVTESGVVGYYWGSTIDGVESYHSYNAIGFVGVYSYNRARGGSVRCIKD
jgi:hypothetical protein